MSGRATGIRQVMILGGGLRPPSEPPILGGGLRPPSEPPPKPDCAGEARARNGTHSRWRFGMTEQVNNLAVAEALAQFPRERTWLLPALQAVQEIVGYLPDWA